MKVLALVLALAACGGATHGVPRDPLGAVTSRELADRALAFERAGDAVRAEQYWVAALAAGFPDDEAIAPLLRVCVASSRYGAALRHARRYRDRHPDDARVAAVVDALADVLEGGR